MLKYKKRLTAFFVSIALLWAFHGYFINLAIRKSIEHSLQSSGLHLSYSNVDEHYGSISFKDLSLKTDEGTVIASSPSLDLLYTFHPLDFLLNLELDWKDPVITLNLDENPLKTILINTQNGSPWINLEGEARIENGTFHLANSSGEKTFQREVSHTYKNEQSAHYNLHSLDGLSAITVDIHGPSFEFEAKKADARLISDLLFPLHPLLESVQIEAGTIDGRLAGHFSGTSDPQFDGQLAVVGLSMKDPVRKAQLQCDAIEFKGTSDEKLAEMTFSKGSISLEEATHGGRLQNFNGSVNLSNALELSVLMNGFLTAKGEQSLIQLKGSSDVPNLAKCSLDISLKHLGDKKGSSTIHLEAADLLSNQSSMACDLHNVRDRELLFAQHMLEKAIPEINPIEFISGVLSGKVRVKFANGAFQEIDASSLDVKNLLFRFKPWEIEAGANEMKGIFAFTFDANGDEPSLEADLMITHGQTKFIGVESDVWHFKDIETRLVVKNGIVQKSSASVSLGGLKGRADIHEGHQSDFMSFSFDGTVQELQPILPIPMTKGLSDSLLDDKIKLTGGVSLIPTGAKILGELNIKSQKGADSPPIHFGFNLEKVKPFLKDSPQALERKERFLKAVGMPLLEKFTPSFLFPQALVEQTHLIREVGYSSFTIKEGFFTAKQLLLEKFVSPFLFPENEMELSGKADVYASFDLTGISLHYRADNVVLQNKALIIAVDHIGSEKGELPAFNRFDLLANQLFGSIPLKNASYFDKDSGLLFTDISTMVYFEGQKVHVDDIEGFSSGLRFVGEVDVDYSLPGKGFFDVEVRVKEVEGLFSQMQNFYAHFDKNAPINSLPLESRISLGPNPGILVFNIKPDDFDFQLLLDLSLFEGSMSFPNLNLTLKDLSANFHYDHAEKLLDMEAIQGMLLQGNPETALEFSFHTDPMRFENFPNSSLPFHIQIKDDETAFVSFKGFLDATTDTTEIAFEPDETRIGSIQPQRMNLSLQGFNRVDSFHASFPLRLSTLLHDLQRFSQNGIFFVTQDWIKTLNDLSAVSGELNADLSFAGDTGKLVLEAAGKDVNFDQHHFKNVHLTGSLRDGKYVIDELALDNLSIACEAHPIDENWKIDFLGIRLGEGLLIGLDGTYHPDDPIVRAHINLFEVDLNKMTEWMSAYPFLDSLKPNGRIKGEGEVAFEKSEDKGWIVDATLNTGFTGLGWKDFSLKDCDRTSCHFRSDKGLTLHHLKSGLKKDLASNDEIEFDLNRLDYDFASQSLGVEDLKFVAAASHLPAIALQLKSELPESSGQEMEELISQLKKDEPLEGTINASLRPGAKDVELKLKDGVYNIWDDQRTISQFTLKLEDEEIQVSSQYLLNDEFVWVAFRINPDYLESGEIVLADTFSSDEEETPLQITWKIDPISGFVIEKAKGKLSGLKFDLVENSTQPSTKDAFHLIGTIEIDGSKAKKILPKMQKEAIETLLLGSGYTIQGQFDIAKEVEKDGDRDVRFFGVLKGSEVELKGYRFQQANAQIILEPSSFQMLDLTLRDLAGTLHVGSVSGLKDLDGSWSLSIPLATAYDFRPGFLREVGNPNQQTRKPLIVKRLYVQDIAGKLSDSSTFSGYGNLYFENPQKKNSTNVLFAIPAEILTRIGLNLSVLTPVSGTIHYEIQNGHIFLTKFKDVYSDRKISKFHLASGAPSTIDFDGNLDIQVRFKQSTLLLKLVEMFMINVQGTLQKPSYSLQRQKYLIKENLYHSTNEQAAHAQ
ncbi:MAG: hypothetical protein ACK5MA_03305 [Parachlamydiaceae bacterium]